MAANNMTQTSEDRSLDSREDTRASEKYLKPAVNIVELKEGLALMADVPGAMKESLDVNVRQGHSNHQCSDFKDDAGPAGIRRIRAGAVLPAIPDSGDDRP